MKKEKKIIKAWAVVKNKQIFYCREEIYGNDIFPFAIFDNINEAEIKLNILVEGYAIIKCAIIFS